MQFLQAARRRASLSHGMLAVMTMQKERSVHRCIEHGWPHNATPALQQQTSACPVHISNIPSASSTTYRNPREIPATHSIIQCLYDTRYLYGGLPLSVHGMIRLISNLMLNSIWLECAQAVEQPLHWIVVVEEDPHRTPELADAQ